MVNSNVVVISLGGSIVVQDRINDTYLHQFKRLLHEFQRLKFVIVVGGGKPARLYMDFLEKAGASIIDRARIGIGITRLNARALAWFFGHNANKKLPKSIKDVTNLLKRDRIVLAGGLRYREENTSDGTAAELAHRLKTIFINVTNVDGLYTADPREDSSARLIDAITPIEFYALAKKKHYKPGQHFILDQHAADIIKRHHVLTYIVGPNINNIRNLLRGKPFVGTTIEETP